MATGVIAAFVLLLSVVAAAAAPPPSTTQGGCTEELLLFSACLSCVSSPPNNLTDTPSANCCDAFSSAVASGGALCLCYFVRYPNILGFPLNTTRLLSLSSICTPTPPLSLNFLCSESPALPPLDTAATLGFTKPGSAFGFGSGSRGGGGGGSSGRMAPKIGGRSPRSSRGDKSFYFPLSNGPVAASTHFCNTVTLPLSAVLAILVTLPVLNMVLNVYHT